LLACFSLAPCPLVETNNFANKLDTCSVYDVAMETEASDSILSLLSRSGLDTPDAEEEKSQEAEAIVAEAIQRERAQRLEKQRNYDEDTGVGECGVFLAGLTAVDSLLLVTLFSALCFSALLLQGWNGRFQNCIAKVTAKNIDEAERISAYSELSTLAQDFIHCVNTYGKIIISEVYTDVDNKTVKPMTNMGFAGG
jgi:Clustered mitochondria